MTVATLTRSLIARCRRRDWRLALVVGITVLQAPPTILGRWVGESRCLGAQASCHDEHVIYQIDSVGARSAVMRGSRYAGSDTVDMGSLSCDRERLAITCAIPVGIWRFRVNVDHLEGSLTRTDGTVTRQVTARRSQSN
jgi:hypothetical protein